VLSSTGTAESRIRTQNATAMDLKVINNATCTFCGCVCDDIQLHHDEVRIHKANKACVLGTAWFLNHTAEKKYPDALIDGQPATLDEAILTTAKILHAADMPLVYGMSNTTCEAQKQCAALADQ
jgi:formylmethanofuran dehydrogenase subunit B